MNVAYTIVIDTPDGWSRDEIYRVCDEAVSRELTRIKSIKTTTDSYNLWLTEGVSDYLGYRAQDKQ